MSRPTSRPINRNGKWLIAAWILAVGLATFAGYQSLFSTFAEYDDEGYVMISIASFMDGHRLYEDTYSQYGPGFFYFSSAIHRIFSIPMTHTAIRLKTLCVWLLLSGITAWVVQRLTLRRWMALAAFIIAFCHLDKLPLEPGHPQEPSALFVAIAVLLGTFLTRTSSTSDPSNERHKSPRRWTRWLVIGLMGAICGLAITTKANVGVLLSIGLGVAFVTQLKHNLSLIHI